MTTYVIDNERNMKLSMVNGDQANITSTGILTTVGTSIEGKSSGNIVQVYGTARSTSGMAIDLGENAYIYNVGMIEGRTGGIKLGAITDPRAGVTNYGSIKSLEGAAVSGNGWLFLQNGSQKNQGLIEGGVFGIDFANGSGAENSLQIHNFEKGIIRGGTAIRGSGSDDIVSSDGLIQGTGKYAVILGGGVDKYLAQDGSRTIGIVSLGDGNDTAWGAEGDETFIAGEGDDSVSGRGGNDTLIFETTKHITVDLSLIHPQDTGEGLDLINGFETLVGGEGNDSFTGDAKNNKLDSGIGSDSLDGGFGADTVIGGRGSDTYWVERKDDVIVEKEGEGHDVAHASASYTLGAGVHVEELHAAGSADIDLAGNEASNRLVGNRGNNCLMGGAGADILDGGEGRDEASYVDSEVGLILDLSDTGKSSGSGRGDVYAAFEAFRGSKHGDFIYGTTQADEIHGDDGDDYLSGGDGNDLLVGGSGHDAFESGAGGDVFKGGLGDDAVHYKEETEQVVVNLGTGEASGRAAGDVYDSIENVIGGQAGDRLTGSAVKNLMAGWGGNDTIDGGGGNLDTALFRGTREQYTITKNADGTVTVTDKEAGRDGADTLKNIRYAEFSNTVLDLRSLPDPIKPGNPSNPPGPGGWDQVLVGTKGKDALTGGLGQDKIHGRYGNDVLTGDGGLDAFVFDAKLGTSKTDRKKNFDTIVDFNVADDTILLDDAIFKKLGKNNSEASPVQLNKKFFKVGAKAKDKNDYIVYNSKTGVLSYDSDGSGRKKAVEFAQLFKNLKMTADDFFIV